MSRRSTTAIALMLCLLCTLASPLQAQNVKVGMYEPALNTESILGLYTTRPMQHLSVLAALQTSYINDLLVLQRDKTAFSRIIGHRIQLEPLFAIGLFGYVDVGLSIPLFIAQYSDNHPLGSGSQRTSGLGDMRLLVKATILRNERFAGFGLAGVIEVSFPTGRKDQFMRERTVTFTPRLIADFRWRNFVVALNIAFRVRKPVRIEDLVIDDELRLGVGVDIPLFRRELALLAEVGSSLNVGRGLGNDGRRAIQDAPMEFRSALRWRTRWGFFLTAGAGVGLTPGYGNPDFRVLLTVGYDNADRKPKRPITRKPPPPDKLNVPPEKPFVRIPGNRFDRLVSTDDDPDGDGIPNSRDRCPNQPEDFDGFEDLDGCPDDDNDRDGIPDKLDKCPNNPETINGVNDDDGCPDKGSKSKIRITGKRIVIGEKIYFKTGSDTLEKRSYRILKQLSGVLKARWDIRLLQIQGHTDNQGDPEMNVDLSERRARRVVSHLVKLGVKRFRLKAKGFGHKVPVAKNSSKPGRAKNRRVTFKILKQVPIK